MVEATMVAVNTVEVTTLVMRLARQIANTVAGTMMEDSPVDILVATTVVTMLARATPRTTVDTMEKDTVVVTMEGTTVATRPARATAPTTITDPMEVTKENITAVRRLVRVIPTTIADTVVVMKERITLAMRLARSVVASTVVGTMEATREVIREVTTVGRKLVTLGMHTTPEEIMTVIAVDIILGRNLVMAAKGTAVGTTAATRVGTEIISRLTCFGLI
jgi:hypothetical protein